jgi:hypothetical protein
MTRDATGNITSTGAARAPPAAIGYECLSTSGF